MPGELGVVKETVYVELLVCTIFKISGEHGAAEEKIPKNKCVDDDINNFIFRGFRENMFLFPLL